MKILNSLNDDQLKAVESNNGAQMIVAGAGSGKFANEFRAGGIHADAA